ncbi:MAG: hutH, partial [Bacteroidetes bacterium]|nr:hutH [Bacteroidota bacterium]
MKIHNNTSFRYGEDFLTIHTALRLARNEIKGKLTTETLSRVKANQEVVKNIVNKKKVVYGINTGFGPLCTSLIDKEET